MRDMLLPHKTSVSTEGELVTLKIGNWEAHMPWDVAIQLSTWLRIRGKEAKRNAGDHSTHWSVIGMLKAVQHGERPWSNGK